MAETTGAAVLVQALRAADVQHIFTLSGNQLLPVYDACLDAGIHLIDTRHEAAAAHMADAWARLRGEPGVCLVSAGPGHTNAVTAVANARSAESPVLWISGGTESTTIGRGGFQEIDQVAVAAPVCKAAWQAETIDQIPRLIARAWYTMLEGTPGPVHLTIPADLLAQATPRLPSPPQPIEFEPKPRAADPSLVERAIDLLAAAARPLIIAGPSAARGRSGESLAEFSSRTGIPWFTMESPRALNDPVLHGAGAASREADVVLLLAPRDYAVDYGGPGAFDPGCRLIQVAPDAREIGRNAPVEIGLIGDAQTVLDQLVACAAERAWDVSDWRQHLDRKRADARARLATFERSDEVPIHPLRLAAEVRDLLPPGSIVSQDGGEFSQWARWAFAGSGHEVLVSGKLAMIGPAIPFAIAAALARPGTPSVAFLGDGTFGFHGMEFDTAVRHGLPFVAVVGNDAGWAAERHRQVARYGAGRVVASDLLPTRYDRVVEALGGHGEYVEAPEQIRPALERALASGKPACLNVMIRSIPSPAAIP